MIFVCGMCFRGKKIQTQSLSAPSVVGGKITMTQMLQRLKPGADLGGITIAIFGQTTLKLF